MPLCAPCGHVRPVPLCAKIDVMFLYSSDSLTRVIGGVTAEQMETLIADELPEATTAAENSEIDLEFNLVHAGPVSGFLMKVYGMIEGTPAGSVNKSASFCSHEAAREIVREAEFTWEIE